MLSRRQFFKLSGAAGVGLALGSRLGPWIPRAFAQNGYIPGGSLTPPDVDKFVNPLVIPPAMPSGGRSKVRGGKNPDYYEIAVRQFSQPILPAPYDPTTVWSYGPTSDPGTVFEGGSFFYPAFTIEAKWRRPVQVNWINDLVDSDTGAYLQHLLPVDPTLHWANPIGRRDTRPNPTDDATYFNHAYIGSDGRYTGPVPMVTHVHGAHTTEESDGYPEAWWLPKGNWDVQERVGTFFDYYNGKYGSPWDRDSGAATFTYPNDQRPTTLWYHDHTLGMTRLNVYAGPAGFYLVRGGPDDLGGSQLPGPAPTVGSDPFGTYYEIPIAIQDRSFNDDGSLFYPDNRAFFHRLEPSQLLIPFTYDQLGINPDLDGWGYGCNEALSDVAPIWNPEFFGNMMVVNGQTWPYLEVEQRRYRFRLLNGCNSRFLILKFDYDVAPGQPLPFYQIGSEGGFLPQTAELGQLLMAPAERADVIVDFTNIPVGTEIILLNLGPDEPFGGGEPGEDFDPADPNSTGQVMQFRVKAATSVDASRHPLDLALPKINALVATAARQVSLNEEESFGNILVTGDDENPPIVYDCTSNAPFGPTAALLGVVDGNGSGIPLKWMDDFSETPELGATETWEIYNKTMDAHPIHLHQIMFQVVDRQPIGPSPTRPPEAWETGWKDTVIAYPGEITRLRARFDLPGLYVWHCHIVEHEDNEMMRPYHVGPVPDDLPHPHM